MKTKDNEAGRTSAVIRDRVRIAALPVEELQGAKPSAILPTLEKERIEITPSVRSMTSKLLSKAKRAASVDGVVTTDAHVMAAVAFVRACGGLNSAKGPRNL